MSSLPATVFWDFENCPFPKDVPVSQFQTAIRTLLSKYGLFANEIHAIGHFTQLSSQNLKALTEIGINMTDVPSKKENAADISILTAMAKVMFFHKPPYGMVLISGDRDFSAAINFMNQVGFFVILVHKESQIVHPGISGKIHKIVLTSAANRIIMWASLFEKEPVISIKLLPRLRKWIPISEMKERVAYVTGESLSQKDLLESLPKNDEIRRLLCRSYGYQCFEAFIPTLRNIKDLSYGKKWVRWVNLNELDLELIKLCGFQSRASWIYLALGINIIDFDDVELKVRINTDYGLPSLKKVGTFSGPKKTPLIQAKEINILLEYLSITYDNVGILVKKALRFGHISLESRSICFEKATIIEKVLDTHKDMMRRLELLGLKDMDEYIGDCESKCLIKKCECNHYSSPHYSFINGNAETQQLSKIKSQRKRNLLPALKFFIDRFGDEIGCVNEIPDPYVKECGFLNQYHWALVADYYDLLSFTQEKFYAKVSQKVISWVKEQSVLDLDLCRFLNSVLFFNEVNSEAKIISSSIANPQIGCLKMVEEDFIRKTYEWAISNESFSERKVTRIDGKQVCLVFPWLLDQDPIQNGRAVDQNNLLYQHPEFIPLIEYIQMNSSDILDIDGFQNSNPGLLEMHSLLSWKEYYTNACRVIDGLKIEESIPPNENQIELNLVHKKNRIQNEMNGLKNEESLSSKVLQIELKMQSTAEKRIRIQKCSKIQGLENSVDGTTEKKSKNDFKINSDSSNLFLEMAVLFLESESKLLSTSVIIRTLPSIYAEKGFKCWSNYFAKGKKLNILEGSLELVTIKKSKCEELLKISGLDSAVIDSLKTKIGKRLKNSISKDAAFRKELSTRKKQASSNEVLQELLDTNILKSRNSSSKKDIVAENAAVSNDDMAKKHILAYQQNDIYAKSTIAPNSYNDYSMFEIIATFMEENQVDDWIDCDRILRQHPLFYRKYGFKKFNVYLKHGESLGILSVEPRPKPWIKMSREMQKNVLLKRNDIQNLQVIKNTDDSQSKSLNNLHTSNKTESSENFSEVGQSLDNESLINQSSIDDKLSEKDLQNTLSSELNFPNNNINESIHCGVNSNDYHLYGNTKIAGKEQKHHDHDNESFHCGVNSNDNHLYGNTKIAVKEQKYREHDSYFRNQVKLDGENIEKRFCSSCFSFFFKG